MEDIPGYDFFGHNNFQHNKESESFEAIVNPFKKAFMPTTWKWFRTSGKSKVFTYIAKRGESTKLKYTIPSQFRKFVIGIDGTPFEGNTITMEGDTKDYFTTGKRVSVSMKDADTDLNRTVTFPEFSFRSNGADYKLDWNYFARSRKVALGAYDEDWGYPQEGKPTYGVASMYDSDIRLGWDKSIKWWWILLGIGALALVAKMFKKKNI